MTIKQHGGIFGRNPTFNDAEVNDLEVNTKAHFPDNAELTFGNSDDLLITHDGSSKITDQGNGALLLSGTNIILQNAAGDQRHIDCNDGGTVEIWHADGKRIQTQSYGAQLFGSLKFHSAGDGIDFSATAGTGTSELFDDYEEGTWTPSFAPATGAFDAISISIATGKYTKVGGIVYVSGYLNTSGAITVGTASGLLSITGLPFSVAPQSEAVGSIWTDPDTGIYASPLDLATKILAAGSSLGMYKDGSDNNSAFTVADLRTAGGNANRFRFSAVYRTA